MKIGNLDISSFKVGAADCSIYLGDVKLYPSSSRLPSGYTEVEYICNSYSGTNTLSTSQLALTYDDEFTPNQTAYTYEVTCELDTVPLGYYYNAYGNNTLMVQRTDSGFGNRFTLRFNSFANPSATETFLANKKYIIRTYQNESDSYPTSVVTNITDGTSNSYTLSKNIGNTSSDTRVGLFNFYNVSDGGAYCMKGKIYEVKIYDRDGNMKAHGIPCIRTSDNKCGFYNLARNEFEYDASGQLELTAGPIVV